MSEKNIIDKTKTPVTKKSILEDLKGLGIEKGDTLLLHSSLSSLGWVCGGAEAVIMALIDAIGEEGTLIMPTHSGENSNPFNWNNPSVPKEWHEIIRNNMPAYDPKTTITNGIGKIPELFRTMPGVSRSLHPQVSFGAIGRLKDDILRNHQLSSFFDMDSPLGKLYKLREAKILLLGAGYDSCTSFHVGETLIGDKVNISKTGSAIYEDGKRIWKWFEAHEHNSDDFSELGKAFENRHKVIKKLVGNAESRLFSLREAVDFSKEWLLENR
ncbi:AAC(3) family N-acetyltransferase [Fusobacteria bacterium ZRK30]|nr:AAC(3) family N-acetyltransferase [Fusobacteria bacterium ZRK30]